MPTGNWSGEGLLGADLAHGLLHAIPRVCKTTIGM